MQVNRVKRDRLIIGMLVNDINQRRRLLGNYNDDLAFDDFGFDERDRVRLDQNIKNAEAEMNMIRSLYESRVEQTPDDRQIIRVDSEEEASLITEILQDCESGFVPDYYSEQDSCLVFEDVP